MTPKTGDKFKLLGMEWIVGWVSTHGFRATQGEGSGRVVYLENEDADFFEWVKQKPWWDDKKYVMSPDYKGDETDWDIEKILSVQKDKMIEVVMSLYPDMSYRSSANEIRSDLLDEVFKKIENV